MTAKDSKPTEHIRLTHDLFYVLSQTGLNDAISVFHAGRSFVPGKSYRVVKRTAVDFPCVAAMDLESDRDFKMEIHVTAHHLPDLKESMMSGAHTPQQKIDLIEKALEGKALH